MLVCREILHSVGALVAGLSAKAGVLPWVGVRAVQFPHASRMVLALAVASASAVARRAAGSALDRVTDSPVADAGCCRLDATVALCIHRTIELPLLCPQRRLEERTGVEIAFATPTLNFHGTDADWTLAGTDIEPTYAVRDRPLVFHDELLNDFHWRAAISVAFIAAGRRGLRATGRLSGARGAHNNLPSCHDSAFRCFRRDPDPLPCSTDFCPQIQRDQFFQHANLSLTRIPGRADETLLLRYDLAFQERDVLCDDMGRFRTQS